MRSMDKLKEVVTDRHQYALNWKNHTGGKVLGYLCTYVPEELIYAAQVLPVRIFGSHELSGLTDRFMLPSLWCPFSRDCLGSVLKGEYDYIDGLAITSCCQHTRQTFSTWVNQKPLEYSHQLFMPSYLKSKAAKKCFAAELEDFRISIQNWLNREILNDEIEEAAEIYNTNRSLLLELYEMRKRDQIKLSAVEYMIAVKSGMLMDKQEHNKLLKSLLDEMNETAYRQTTDKDLTPRLMLIGSCNDDTNVMELIESTGSVVVADDLCMGSRYFLGRVKGEENVIEKIANRYIDRPPCPLKDLGVRSRQNHIIDLAVNYNVWGAVYLLQRLCDGHAYDVPAIEKALSEIEIPMYRIELDMPIAEEGLRTRIEAFIEMLYAKRKRVKTFLESL